MTRSKCIVTKNRKSRTGHRAGQKGWKALPTELGLNQDTTVWITPSGLNKHSIQIPEPRSPSIPGWELILESLQEHFLICGCWPACLPSCSYLASFNLPVLVSSWPWY